MQLLELEPAGFPELSAVIIGEGQVSQNAGELNVSGLDEKKKERDQLVVQALVDDHLRASPPRAGARTGDVKRNIRAHTSAFVLPLKFYTVRTVHITLVIFTLVCTSVYVTSDIPQLFSKMALGENGRGRKGRNFASRHAIVRSARSVTLIEQS